MGVEFAAKTVAAAVINPQGYSYPGADRYRMVQLIDVAMIFCPSGECLNVSLCKARGFKMHPLTLRWGPKIQIVACHPNPVFGRPDGDSDTGCQYWSTCFE